MEGVSYAKHNEMSEFVATTLNEIVDGVKSAQEYASKNGAIVNAQDAFIDKSGRLKQNMGGNSLASTTIDFDIMLSNKLKNTSRKCSILTMKRG